MSCRERRSGSAYFLWMSCIHTVLIMAQWHSTLELCSADEPPTPRPRLFPSPLNPASRTRRSSSQSLDRYDVRTLRSSTLRFPAGPPYVFLKYELDTVCPATMLNIVSPAPKYPSAIRRIEESGIWSVAGLMVSSGRLGIIAISHATRGGFEIYCLVAT